VSPGWRYIHTHFGVGYRFAPEPVGGAPAPAPAVAAPVAAEPVVEPVPEPVPA
jgi:hypothetical protein